MRDPTTDHPVPSWEVLSSEEELRCRVFSVERHHMREAAVPGESAVKEGDFHVLDCPDWVNVVALTDDDELVLIEQWRHGIRLVTLEIPGGMVDKDEPPEAAARRELLEETGYAADSFTKIGMVHPNPAIQNNHCYTYLARGAKRVGDPAFDSHERCKLRVVPWASADQLVREGTITHALVVAAISFAHLASRRSP